MWIRNYLASYINNNNMYVIYSSGGLHVHYLQITNYQVLVIDQIENSYPN